MLLGVEGAWEYSHVLMADRFVLLRVLQYSSLNLNDFILLYYFFLFQMSQCVYTKADFTSKGPRRTRELGEFPVHYMSIQEFNHNSDIPYSIGAYDMEAA